MKQFKINFAINKKKSGSNEGAGKTFNLRIKHGVSECHVLSREKCTGLLRSCPTAMP